MRKLTSKVSHLHMVGHNGSLSAKPELSPEVETLARGLPACLHLPPLPTCGRHHVCIAALALERLHCVADQPLTLILLQSIPTREARVILQKQIRSCHSPIKPSAGFLNHSHINVSSYCGLQEPTRYDCWSSFQLHFLPLLLLFILS